MKSRCAGEVQGGVLQGYTKKGGAFWFNDWSDDAARKFAQASIEKIVEHISTARRFYGMWAASVPSGPLHDWCNAVNDVLVAIQATLKAVYFTPPKIPAPDLAVNPLPCLTPALLYVADVPKLGWRTLAVVNRDSRIPNNQDRESIGTPNSFLRFWA